MLAAAYPPSLGEGQPLVSERLLPGTLMEGSSGSLQIPPGCSL